MSDRGRGYDALDRYRPDALPPRRPFWLLALIFAATYVALFLAYLALQQGPFRALLIDTLTVKPAARLIGLVDGSGAVRAVGHLLVWPGGRLSVLNGCDAAETMTLVVCAMLIADMRWKARLAGIAAGVALIHALNQVRLLALYLLFRGRSEWFDAVHVALAPLALIAAAAAFYLAWNTRFGLHRDEPA